MRILKLPRRCRLLARPEGSYVVWPNRVSPLCFDKRAELPAKLAYHTRRYHENIDENSIRFIDARTECDVPFHRAVLPWSDTLLVILALLS